MKVEITELENGKYSVFSDDGTSGQKGEYDTFFEAHYWATKAITDLGCSPVKHPKEAA